MRKKDDNVIKSLASEFETFVSVLAAPSEVFGSLREKPHWRVPLTVNLLLYMIAAILMIEAYRHMFMNISNEIFGETTAPTMVRMFMRVPLLFVLTSEGFAIPLRWFVFSMILFASNVRSVKSISFRDVFLCVLFAEVILSLMRLVNVLLLYVVGLETISTHTDLFVIPGVQLILTETREDYSLFALASSYNIFSVWYIVTLGLGFAFMFGVSRLRALFWSFACWNTWIGLTILRPYVEKLIMRPLTQ